MSFHHFHRLSPERQGVVLAVLAATGFSLKAIFVKLAYAAGPVDALTLLSLRMLFSLPIFLWFGRSALVGLGELKRKDWGALVLLGLLGYYGASILDFMGLQYISAGLERLILFTYPTLTLLIGVVWFGHRMSTRHVVALGLTYCGIGLAFAHDWTVAGDLEALLMGAGLVFASALSYAMYSAGAEPMVKRLGALRFALLASLVSTTATQLHFIVARPVENLQQPMMVYVWAIAMALFSTVLPVIWQSTSIRMIGSARAVLIGTLGPVLTIVFGYLMLGEPISIYQVMGSALVLSGVYVISKKA